MRLGFAVAGGLIGLAGWAYLFKDAEPVPGDVAPDNEPDDGAGVVGGLAATEQSLDEFLGGFVKNLSGWSADKIPTPYVSAIQVAEDENGIPRNLLARLLWQESRYREDIISGKTRSSAGAVGFAQFLPGTARELGINPLNPFESISGAGVYLARLYKSTGTWTKALAAYNWGIGNLKRKGLAAAPRETRNYYTEILADVGGGTIA